MENYKSSHFDYNLFLLKFKRATGEIEAEHSHIFSGWSKVRDALTSWERLKDDCNFDSQLENDIRRLKPIMEILIPLVWCILKWQAEDLDLKYSLHSVASILQNLIQEFEARVKESRHILEAEDLNSYSTATVITASSLVALRLMEPEIRKLHFAASRFSGPLHPGEAVELVRFINLLLENLNVILYFQADFLICLREQIIVLRFFFGFLSESCDTYMASSCAKALAVNTACLLYLILVGKSEYLMDHVQALRSLIKGLFSTGKYALGFFDFLIRNFRELPDEWFGITMKEPIENLLKRLTSVSERIVETPSNNYEEGLENFRAELVDLIIDLGCLICSKKGLESQEKLDDILDKVQFIESASGVLLIPTSWQYNFPKTNELGFVDFILVNLGERLNLKMVSTDVLNWSIETVYGELVKLRHDFEKIVGVHKENEELRSVLTDVAYHAEYLFDLSLSATESSAYQRLGLTGLRESIRQISRKVEDIANNMTSDNLVHKIAGSPGGVSLEANPACIVTAKHPKDEAGSRTDNATDKLVGLEEERKNLKGELVSGSKQLKILSIVGMPGIGKTTLANSVYGDPEVTLHFHARAWCTVSQVCQKQNLLNEILRQVQREPNQDLEKNDEDLELQLMQGLKGKRYLVILDDIWEAGVWADLRLCFPDDGKGSRVLFTTRNRDVANQANSVCHDLRLLSAEESWKLLKVKVFREETCPAELLQVGRIIAEDCKGLPLAVVLIAGVLKSTERKQHCWGGVAGQLRTYVTDYASRQQSGTLELSYMHLPDYLKPCLLYFGAFPEDKEIRVPKLLHLWIAEGFVQQPKGDQISLEYVAEAYLNALIDRSLVIIAKKSSRGGVKACRIHDLLHHFCLVRAEEERFLLPRTRPVGYPTFRISEIHEQYRLCIVSDRIPSVRMGHFESRVRTLLFSESFVSALDDFSTESCSRPGYNDHLKGIAVLDKFRLLRVLDLSDFSISRENDFVIISRLVYLRFLAIRADAISKIPAEMANLKNLETFLLRVYCEIRVSLETIWSMENLRHLHVGARTCLNFVCDSPKEDEGLWPLENLTTFSNTQLHCDQKTEKMMRNLPNLRKLKCTFLHSCYTLNRCTPFLVLDFLSRL